MTNPTNLRPVGAGEKAAESANRELIEHMSEPNPLVARDLDQRLIIHSRTRNEAAYNSFRELRTDLLQRSGGQNFVAVVSSIVPGGGATHVAVNLASAIAFDRSKTALLVDCNVNNPGIHERLGLERDPGLTDFLADPDSVAIEDVIRPTGIPRLRAICAGSHLNRSSEYFSTVNMRLMVHMLQQRYPDRFIIMDAPSMRSAADTRVLANYADLSLLVVPYGRVTTSRVLDASKTFNQEKFAGVVFNRLPNLFGD